MFPIVGVGASAGGLEAFTQLLSRVPADAGIAFVLVQHLSPTHPSALAEILARHTAMPVAEVDDEATVEANHVYVIPPDRCMAIEGGVLKLTPRPPGHVHRTIDFFFLSLAADQGHRAIGVVLSGTATDGTLGLEAIKAEGGITFAQDNSAQHEGMPQSAVASGVVDFVLAPGDIAHELARIARHPQLTSAPEPAIEDEHFAAIVNQLERATGVDFTQYKSTTVNRRITRRMLLKRLSTPAEYSRYVAETPEELDALYQDMLIGVTSFFRDKAVFDALVESVFPQLVEGRSGTGPVRMWSLGCSTGEEAYSLAIAFTEYTAARGILVPLQLFATDLSASAIDRARAGVYPGTIAQDLSAERLERFFVEIEGGYRIRKSIRDACVFSRHNVLGDPPFSQLDVITCRNLLIYLQPAEQQRVIPMLHYALKPTGFLCLGISETIGQHRELFQVQDGKHRIFRKKPWNHRPLIARSTQRSWVPGTSLTTLAPRDDRRGGELQREAERVLLATLVPPAVLVNTEMEILQFRGDTSAFLTPAPGKASLNLLKMLRDGLLVGVRAAVERASRDGIEVRDDGLRVLAPEGPRDTVVRVIPVSVGSPPERGFLVLFESPRGVVSPSGSSKSLPRADGDQGAAVETARLGRELAATNQYLKTVVEQHEASTEELQAAHEEVQSANEELQSINEELETSKEEIQSSNEELATVNDELSHRNAEVNRANNDLVNLLSSVQMAIVMLGPDLRIRRFTPRAEKLLNLIAGDVGRPLVDITLNLTPAPPLEEMLAEVRSTMQFREFDVRDRRGTHYSLRVGPYRTQDNSIDGVVLTFVDVDALKRAEEYTKAIVDTVRSPILVLDEDLRVRTANSAFYKAFQEDEAGTESQLVYQLGNGQWDIPDLRRLLGEVLQHNATFQDFEITHDFEHLGCRTMVLNARTLPVPGESALLILLAIEDATERRAIEGEQVERERHIREILDALPVAMYTTDADGYITRSNPAASRLAGRSPTIGRDRWCVCDTLYHPDGSPWPLEECPIAVALTTGVVEQDIEMKVERPDGSLAWVTPFPTLLRDAEGRVSGSINVLVDVSHRKFAEGELLRSSADLTEADRRKDEFLATLAHELRNPLAPIQNALSILRLSPELGNARGRDMVRSTTALMERQVTQLARLVDDLLDAHRISHGKIELRRTRVDLAPVIEQAVDACAQQYARLGQQLHVQLPTVPIQLSADAARLTQIVGNLLNNASKFTPPGGEVWVDVDAVEGEAIIRVRDSGIGLSQTQLSRIFDVFVQVDTSVERMASGLGIGLTLVRRLVELHGGNVEARSAGLGAGSEFIVRLPITAQEASPAAVSGDVPPLPSWRILVVDDNHDAATALSTLLELRGHRIQSAHDGLTAIGCLSAFRPDVVLMDIGMPLLSGHEVARRMRALPEGRSVLLVAMTGWGQAQDHAQSHEAGFDAHLVKPVDLATLERLLRERLL